MNRPRSTTAWFILIGVFAVLTLNGCELSNRSGSAAGSGAPWPTSHQDALAQSNESGKPILMLFTGTDWCIWCKRLEKEVFETSAFESWADEHVVLLKLDFPQYSSLPEKVAQQNDELLREYERYVEGFPTVLITDANGKVVGQMGYESGGPSSWIASAERILDANPR